MSTSSHEHLFFPCTKQCVRCPRLVCVCCVNPVSPTQPACIAGRAGLFLHLFFCCLAANKHPQTNKCVNNQPTQSASISKHHSAFETVSCNSDNIAAAATRRGHGPTRNCPCVFVHKHRSTQAHKRTNQRRSERTKRANSIQNPNCHFLPSFLPSRLPPPLTHSLTVTHSHSLTVTHSQSLTHSHSLTHSLTHSVIDM